MNTMSNLTTHDYHIGWICPLEQELTAAIAMLDEEHEPITEQAPNDNNCYTLGRIGKHNVVLACLPEGEMGGASAASVARDMARTFPTLRFALLVGVGGGLPDLSKGIDIRLGDVVVSKPTNTGGGVVQYDMGTALAGGNFKNKGHLNQPPTLLLTALTQTRARLPFNRSKLFRYIDDASAQIQVDGFAFPVEVDTLHCKACDRDIEQPNAECNEFHNQRLPRRDKTPVIHYGVIASGNQVIKDALVRDRLRDEFNAMCVEMEAAGLMNGFPCLVIRGICDYADSHKNDIWQGYAAMAAAACTKDLLQYIPPEQTGKIQPIGEISDILSLMHETARVQLDITQSQLQESSTRYETERQSECHHVFKVTCYEVQKNINPERVPGTCQWVLTHPRYADWCSQNGDALLWISADPGCGKSVLARSLIDGELQHTANHSVCYFFFKDNGEQDTLSTAISSLLHQLFSQQPGLIGHAMDAWEKNGNKIVKEVYELWRILLSSTRDAKALNVICVLDALDECRHSDRTRLIRMLTEFYAQTAAPPSTTRRCSIKFLVTSRPYEDIEDGFRESIAKLPNIRLKGEDENEQIHQEIDLVVRMRVEKLTNDLSLDNQTSNKLTEKLLSMEHRTYLWLYLAIDSIYETHRTSLRPDEAVIDTLPSSVEDAYEKILQRVSKAQSDNTTRVLQIIVGARRPLTTGAMAIALGMATSKFPVNLKQAKLSNSWLEDNIRHWCGLFIFINHGRIYLIHQTAKEFLTARDGAYRRVGEWKNCLESAQSEELMGRICTTFLCSDTVEKFARDRQVKLDKAANSFFKYSAEHWPSHFRYVQRQPHDEAFMTGILVLYCTHGYLFRLWHPVYEKRKEGKDSNKGVGDRLFEVEGPSWNHHEVSVAAMLGHGQMLKWMLQTQRSYSLNLALIVASGNGHDGVVERLLKHDIRRLTLSRHSIEAALLRASEGGHETVIRMLIQADKRFDAKIIKNALWEASRGGHSSSVQILLETHEGKGGRASDLINEMSAALNNSHEDVAQLLLRRGARVNVYQSDELSPLYAAAQSGCEGMVSLLIHSGADIDHKGGEHGTALHAAVKNNHAGVVRMLLDSNANVKIGGSNSDPRTVLQLASRIRRGEITLMLKQHIQRLRKGAMKRPRDDAAKTSAPAAKRRRADR